MRLIILGWDGVVSDVSDTCIKTVNEWRPIDGSLEAVSRLNQADYHMVIVNSQATLAGGLLEFDTLNQSHEKMLSSLSALGGAIDAILFCPHAPNENCQCSNPQSGLLNDVARRFQVELNGVSFIGGSLEDIQAAQAAHAKPIAVNAEKWQKSLANTKGLNGIPVHENLAIAVDALLQVEQQHKLI